jgi:tetratricopeptide (TPR) repeat protein/transcriptional regulator with XRE-family HTH domain
VAEQQATFGGLLRELRADAKLTQEELAEASGVRPRSISDLERGIVVRPRRVTVQLLADALNLSGPVRARFEAVARGRAVYAETVTDALGASAEPTLVVTRTLPRDIASFIGRQHELRQLVDTVNGAAGSGGVVSIYAVGGMAGIGKTAFAVHAAHQLAPRFPAGQIFLSLHGYTPGRKPVDVGDALASLLLTIGIPAARIPPSVEARMALWRDRLAERQLLLVLDDAADSAQVLPLLPGTGGSLVLVTSRRHLTALEDATPISLDMLPPDDAANLLVRLAGRPRLNASNPAVDEVTRLCGYLPLAIGIVGRQVHHHPAWSLSRRAMALATARDRLELMVTENLSVAAAFDLSYEDLPSDQRRLFRRLGLHPGTDIDAYATAALGGIDFADACRGLESLYDQYLLTESTEGRYRMHDLIRAHARMRANEEDSAADREAAMDRLLDYYQHVAQQADQQIARLTPAYVPGARLVPRHVPVMDTREQADAWMRDEVTNLIAVAEYSAERACPSHAVAIPAAMHWYLRYQGPWPQAIKLHSAAADIALALNDWRGRANALDNLGVMRREVGDYPGAVIALDQALNLYRQLSDSRGQANVLTSLGVVRALCGDYPDAGRALDQALDMHSALGDQRGQASDYNNLANVRLMSGDYRGGVDALQMALKLHRSRNDLQGQAGVLNNLGVAHWRTGDYQAAGEVLELALAAHRALGDQWGQANALGILGMVRQSLGDYNGAANAHSQALDLYRLLGNRHGQASAFGNLANVRRVTGDHAEAAQAYEKALAIFRELGDRGAEAEALNEYAKVLGATGHLEQARAHHGEALRLGQEVGSPQIMAEAFEGIGEICYIEGAVTDAARYLRQARDIYHDLGTPDEQRISARLEEFG